MALLRYWVLRAGRIGSKLIAHLFTFNEENSMNRAHQFSDWEHHLRNSEWLAQELHSEKGSISAFTCKSDMMFQIVHHDGSEVSRGFGSWTKGMPDRSAYKCFVDLNFAGATVLRFEFAQLDGGRYFVPIPRLRVREGVEEGPDAVEYYYDSKSLDFLVGNVTGEFYRSDSLEEFAYYQGIKIL